MSRWRFVCLGDAVYHSHGLRLRLELFQAVQEPFRGGLGVAIYRNIVAFRWWRQDTSTLAAYVQPRPQFAYWIADLSALRPSEVIVSATAGEDPPSSGQLAQLLESFRALLTIHVQRKE